MDFDSMRLGFGVKKSQKMTPNPLENLSRSRKRTVMTLPAHARCQNAGCNEKAPASPCRSLQNRDGAIPTAPPAVPLTLDLF